MVMLTVYIVVKHETPNIRRCVQPHPVTVCTVFIIDHDHTKSTTVLLHGSANLVVFRSDGFS